MPLWIFLLISATAFSVTNEETAWQDVACLAGHNPSACVDGLRQPPSPHRRRFLGTVGCNQFRSGAVCDQWGVDLEQAKDLAQAEKTYQLGCELGAPSACLHLLKLIRQQAETLAPEKVLPLTMRSKPIASRACDLEKKDPSLCVQAEQVLAELSRGQDATFGLCRLKFIWLDRRNYAVMHGEKADAPGLRNLGTHEQCVQRCAAWLNDMAMPEESLGYLRGLCEFQGRNLPPAQWHHSRPRFCAERQSLRAGYGADQLFPRCYCETSPHDDVMAVAEKFGIFAMGVSAYSKTFGRSKWSRCGLRFFYDDEVAARKDRQACRDNLASFRRELSSVPSDKTFDYDYGNLKCE